MKKEPKKKMKMWDCVLCVVIGVIIIMAGLSSFIDATSTENKYKGTRWVAQETKKEAGEKKIGSIIVIGVGCVFLCVGIFDYSKRKQKYMANISNTENSSNNSDSVAVKLKELKEMLEQKNITEEEYENKKKELLDKM